MHWTACSYTFYIQEHRVSTVQDHPDLSFGEVAQLLGAKWQALDDASKGPYYTLAHTDSRRYEQDRHDGSALGHAVGVGKAVKGGAGAKAAVGKAAASPGKKTPKKKAQKRKNGETDDVTTGDEIDELSDVRRPLTGGLGSGFLRFLHLSPPPNKNKTTSSLSAGGSLRIYADLRSILMLAPSLHSVLGIRP